MKQVSSTLPDNNLIAQKLLLCKQMSITKDKD